VIYFDNAATSFPKAPEVASEMARFLAHDAANPGRAGHRMAVAAERMLDEVRLKLTRLVKGGDHHRMVFTLNATDALNIALKGVLPALSSADGRKPHVITTVLEHNSVSRPLQALTEQGCIELTRVACDGEGFVDPHTIRNAITTHTKLIAMTHASNVLGTIQDAAAVGAIAREHDILFLLDAAQTIGAAPISVQALQVDLLAFPGHKSLLGPTGTGGLYVGERCPLPSLDPHDQGRLRPWREGGTGGDSATPTMPDVFPYYLEGGTPNTVGIAGLGAAVDQVIAAGIGKALAHERGQVQRILDRFAEDDRFMIYGPRDAARRVGTLSLNINGLEPADVGSILDDSFGIAVRPGLHCAPYAHRHLGTFPGGAVRISPGPFNTDAELDTLIDALDQIAG
jgi:cysteine desulfurase family protein